MARIGHRKRASWAFKHPVSSGELIVPSKVPEKMPYGLPSSPQGVPKNGFSRLVPSGSPGGPARPPLVPGGSYKGLSDLAKQAAKHNAALRKMMLKGLLGKIPYAQLVQMLEEFSTWYSEDNPPIVHMPPGSGWSRCATPNACPPAITHQYLPGGVGTCTGLPACPNNQLLAASGAKMIGTFVGSNVAKVWHLQLVNKPLPTTWRFHIPEEWVRPVPGTPYAPWVRVPMLPAPIERTHWPELSQPRDRPYVRLKPGELVAIEFTPRGPTGGKPVIHRPQPPRPPNKELKRKMDWGIPGKVYGELTEFRDMMDCFAEASGMAKPKGPIGERARRIYEHLNASNPDGSPKHPIDSGKFAQCMLLANAKDFAIGKLSNQTAKNLNRSPYVSPRPGGYRGGGFGTRMLNI